MKVFNDELHNLVYNADASHLLQHYPVEVFLVDSKEEIIECVKNAVKEGKKIVCRGGGTNLVGNCLPEEGFIVIDVSKLNEVLEIRDEYVVVQPGITNDQLNEKLLLYRRFFPVVLGSHASAEIGGMIATNGAGMRAIKYGKMQEWVEELEVLIVSENKQVEIRHLLYDEAKDFFGAEGFLGIILEVKLKVIEKNEGRSIDFKCFENLTDCLNYVKEIRACKNPDLSALEIINPKVAGYLNLEKKYYILVEYENSIDGSIKDQEEIKNIRGKRDACYAVTVNAGFDQIEDPEINEGEEEFFNRFEQHDIPIFGHIGIGVLHPHFRSEQKNLEKEMYELVQKLGGNVSGEHGIGKKKRVYLSKENQEKMENLKRKRDPTNIFGF